MELVYLTVNNSVHVNCQKTTYMIYNDCIPFKQVW